MNYFFRIDTAVVKVLGYPLSAIEIIGILTGILSVIDAARGLRRSWTIGLVNEVSFFIFFYQVQLYAEMLLQVFFALLTLYGLYSWKDKQSLPDTVTTLTRHEWIVVLIATTVLSSIFTTTAELLPEVLPEYFPYAATFAFQDGVTTALSIVATYLLARRSIESWIFWIVVDGMSVCLYLQRGIPFMALLYSIFLVIALSGFQRWTEYETRTCIR